jgi:predicted dehydrogenase
MTMALDMTPEQRDIGKANFDRAVDRLAAQSDAAPRRGPTRRGFMRGLMAAGAAVPLSAAAYFGYTRLRGRPVRAGLIGAGDEGGVLVGEHNPLFVEFIACCDVRPTNKERIFTGEPQPATAGSLWRKGFNRIYGSNARQSIHWYDDYEDMLRDPDIELIVIALPLHLHDTVAIKAMQAGKHVLCEKLMARTIGKCKEMIRVSDATHRYLAIGHQRHYSLLYAQALELIHSGVLGDIKHIRALWHRNMLPERDGWRKPIAQADRDALTADRLRALDYKDIQELCHWRLYRHTGGGLMAELGSHQLDACSIFLGKVHPLAVSGTGLKCYYKDNREIEDHVYCHFEFPGKQYEDKPLRSGRGVPQYNDVVAVSYSSISTNGFENYGECIMGTKGTLVVQTESEALLYPPAATGRSTQLTVVTQSSGQSAVDSWGSGPAPAGAQTAASRPGGSVIYSRGYKEEMEHLAYCIRMRPEGPPPNGQIDELMPRCHGRAAMADAIIALSANEAFRSQRREEIAAAWFTDDTDVPRAVPTWDRESDLA